jgi:hypothetical protein
MEVATTMKVAKTKFKINLLNVFEFWISRHKGSGDLGACNF